MLQKKCNFAGLLFNGKAYFHSCCRICRIKTMDGTPFVAVEGSSANLGVSLGKLSSSSACLVLIKFNLQKGDASVSQRNATFGRTGKAQQRCPGCLPACLYFISSSSSLWHPQRAHSSHRRICDEYVASFISLNSFIPN